MCDLIIGLFDHFPSRNSHNNVNMMEKDKLKRKEFIVENWISQQN